jgi:FMN phosphatase YigB (HAD superfamily)
VVPALVRLRAAGLRLVVVSNANGRLRAAFDRIGLTPHLDDVIDSTEVGYEKPDAAIFRLALARAGTEAPRAVHVGDLYHVDVVGARATGVRAVPSMAPIFTATTLSTCRHARRAGGAGRGGRPAAFRSAARCASMMG